MSMTVKIEMSVFDTDTNQTTAVSSRSETLPGLSEFSEMGFAESFNALETVMIKVRNETTVETIEKLYGNVSREIVREAQTKLSSESPCATMDVVPYRVEAEIGRLNITAHILKIDDKIRLDTSKDYFIPLKGREGWRSSRFKELELLAYNQMSARATTKLINRIRNSGDLLIPTTLRNQMEREGLDILAVMEQTSEDALSKTNFDSWGQTPPVTKGTIQKEHLNHDVVASAADELGISSFDPAEYETNGVNISADDVLVKGQNPKRPMPDGAVKAKFLANTVVHIEHGDEFYVLNGSSVGSTLRLAAGFLAHNDLLQENNIVFFTDGARSLLDHINTIFCPINYKIILDWHHVHKKVKDLGSLIFKGRNLRNQFVNDIAPILWRGEVDNAIDFINKVDKKSVKDVKTLEKLTGYFERVRNYIPCYALRRRLGLRTSSNLVEKENDLLVAKRQKKNGGMCWSREGSRGLAAVAGLFVNDEVTNWVTKKRINFKLQPKKQNSEPSKKQVKKLLKKAA
jgi:hypothetical protein